MAAACTELLRRGHRSSGQRSRAPTSGGNIDGLLAKVAFDDCTAQDRDQRRCTTRWAAAGPRSRLTRQPGRRRDRAMSTSCFTDRPPPRVAHLPAAVATSRRLRDRCHLTRARQRPAAPLVSTRKRGSLRTRRGASVGWPAASPTIGRKRAGRLASVGFVTDRARSELDAIPRQQSVGTSSTVPAAPSARASPKHRMPIEALKRV